MMIERDKKIFSLLPYQADAIRSKYNSNAKKKKQKNKEYTYRSLAEEYGVHHETIRQIILNNTYVKEGGEVL